MRIVVIEFIDEFEAFLSFVQRSGAKLEDFVIIALEPKLQVYLKKNGVDFHDTLLYFTNDSHKKMVVETERIMGFIQERMDFTDRNGLHRCYVNEIKHHVRLYLNLILRILEILDNIHREHGKCEIFAYVRKWLEPSYVITDSERYLGMLAAIFTQSRGLRFTNINGDDTLGVRQGKDENTTRNLRWFIMPFIRLLTRGRKTVFMPQPGSSFESLAGMIHERDKDAVFMAVNYTGSLFKILVFNIFSACKVFVHKGIPLYYFPIAQAGALKADMEEQGRLEKAVAGLVHNENRQVYEFAGVNYFDLLKEKVEAGLSDYILKMLSLCRNLKALFDAAGEKLLISYSASGVMGAAGELAARIGVPALFVSHGAHSVPVDAYHETELLNLCRGFMLGDYSCVALNTPVQERHLKYFKERYPWVRNREIKTGSLVFASLNGLDRSGAKAALGIAPDELVLTHAVTSKERSGERFYFIETRDEFLSSLSDIVNVINMHDSMKLIVRVHPGFNLTDDEIMTMLPDSERVTINRHGAFADVLAATDILISYSSTTIDEALMNDIPVLLYDKWMRYNHFKTGVYSGPGSPDIYPVCYVNESDKLSSALEFMKENIQSPDNGGTDFTRYRYTEDYKDNFFGFIKESLERWR